MAFKKTLYIVALYLLALQVKAQYVPIPDTAFANVLKEADPTLLSLDGTQLDTTVAKLSTIAIYFKDRGTVQSLEGLQYFEQITLLNGANNKVSFVPDLSRLTKLRTLNLLNNKIPSLTGIEYMTELIHLLINTNELTTLTGYDQLPNLVKLQLGSNHLRTFYLPQNNGVLDAVGLGNNMLSWEQIDPILTYPGYDTIFTAFPQKELSNDTTVTLVENERFEISYPFDAGITDLHYVTQKNNADNYPSSLDPTFVIEHIALSDAGIYEVFAKSYKPEWGTSALVTGETRLKVTPCQEIQSFSFSQTEICPNTNVLLDDILLGDDTVPFSIYLQNTEDNLLTAFTVGQSRPLVDGTYNLLVTDGAMCSKSVDSVVTIQLSSECTFCDSLKNIALADTVFKVLEHDTVVLQLPALEGMNQLSYTWKLDNAPVAFARDSALTLSGLTLSQAGDYQAVISCPLADATSYPISSQTFSVEVDVYQSIDQYSFSTTEYCDSLIIHFDLLNLSNTRDLFSTFIEHSATKVRYPILVGESRNVPAGMYHLLVTNGSFYTEIIDSAVSVTTPAACQLCDSLASLTKTDTIIQLFEHDGALLQIPEFTGNELLSFQWFADESPIANAYKTEYDLVNAQVTDEAHYYIEISCQLPQGETLVFESRRFDVSVADYQSINNYEFSSVQTCELLSVTQTSLSLSNTRDAFTSKLHDPATNEEYPLSMDTPVTVTEGTFSLIVTNGTFYSDTITNAITVQTPSECVECGAITNITLPDTTISVREYDTVHLSAAYIQSSRMLTYEWYHNGTLLPNQKAAVLELSSVKMQKAGTYYAAVRCPMDANGTFATNSRTFTIQVSDHQSIIDYRLSTSETCDSLTITLENLVLENTDETFSLFIEHAISGISRPISLGTPVSVLAGSYHLTVSNDLSTTKIDSAVTVAFPTDCMSCQKLASETFSDKTFDLFEYDAVKFDLSTLYSEANLSYQWYFNDAEIANATSEQYAIDTVFHEKAGVFYAAVTCPTASGKDVVFHSPEYRVSVADYQTIKHFELAKSETCNELTVTLTTIELSNINPQFVYFLINNIDNSKIAISADTAITVQPGTYHFQVADTTRGYSIVEKHALEVDYPTNCSDIFSPNGDGIMDTWYVESATPVRIVDKSGTVVKTTPGTFHWDGRDNAGKELPMGVYSIVFGENLYQRITLVR